MVLSSPNFSCPSSFPLLIDLLLLFRLPFAFINDSALFARLIPDYSFTTALCWTAIQRSHADDKTAAVRAQTQMGDIGSDTVTSLRTELSSTQAFHV